MKIRGFRIELGEIEARLQAEPEVREAVVVAREGASGKRLVAYVVAEQRDPNLCETLKARLQASLPDYMVPAQWLLLDRLPVTANGKLDRQNLPEPDALQSQRAYAAPHSEVERALAAIWQAVLKVERVGLHDNFFELGGDSIIAIQVVSRARAADLSLTPKDLFQHQSLQSLAAAARPASSMAVAQGPAQGRCQLTPIQHWFFAQHLPQPQHWNQSLLLHIDSPLDADALAQALAALVQAHDALRLRFAADGAAHYAGTAEAPLWQREAADAQALLAHCEAAQRSLDLSHGPLLRALSVTMADGSQRLLLVIHHLVVDGVSWRILLDDLQQAYRQAAAGQRVALAPRTSALGAWTERLRTYAEQAPLQAERAFWLRQSQDATLPCDRPQGGNTQVLARRLTTRLDSDVTRCLLQDAPAAYRTQINDLLLSALARVLCRWSGASSALVQLEGHGREALFDDLDLSRSVGWFTSAYPVRLTPSAELGASIKAIKEQLRAVPHKGIGYGVLRYLGDSVSQALLAQMPAPQVTFNYLGQFDTSFEGDSLFTPAREARGAEQDPQAPMGNLLSINGQIYGGALAMDWSFSRERFDDATVQALADDYAAELQALVAHCVAHAPGRSDPVRRALDRSRSSHPRRAGTAGAADRGGVSVGTVATGPVVPCAVCTPGRGLRQPVAGRHRPVGGRAVSRRLAGGAGRP